MVIDQPSLLAVIVGVISIYLMIPVGIPFLTPVNTILGMIRSINFTIGVLVAVFLYINEFTLLESVFIGTFWSSYLAYLIMVYGRMLAP